jgi:hypothetical protein
MVWSADHEALSLKSLCSFDFSIKGEDSKINPKRTGKDFYAKLQKQSEDGDMASWNLISGRWTSNYGRSYTI